MKRILVIAAVMAMTALATPAAAAGPASFVIRGSGATADVGTPSGGDRQASIHARQYEDGTVGGRVRITVVQNGSLYSKIRGEVVCIEAMTATDGSQGYEVRYVVTSASGGAAVAPNRYDSIFVRDDPAGDQTDQVYPNNDWFNPACGLNDAWVDWDTVAKGDIKVLGELT